MSSEPVRIAIVLEGGIVSQVLSAGVPVEYIVVDYDTDGVAPTDLVRVPQDDGFGPADAHVSVDPLDADASHGPFVLQAFERFGQQEEV